MRRLLKRAVPLLLLALALLVGFFLPELQVTLRERHDAQPEPSGIEAVNLAVSSNLSAVDKLALFQDDLAEATAVASGQYLTEAEAKRGAEAYLEKWLWDSYTASDAVLYLLTAREQHVLLWRVICHDPYGTEVTLWLDDETSSILSYELYYNAAEAETYDDGIEQSEEAYKAEAGAGGLDSAMIDEAVYPFADFLQLTFYVESTAYYDDKGSGTEVMIAFSDSENNEVTLPLWADSRGVSLNAPKFAY